MKFKKKTKKEEFDLLKETVEERKIYLRGENSKTLTLPSEYCKALGMKLNEKVFIQIIEKVKNKWDIYLQMKCKKCKSLMIERGFTSNRRWECSACGFVYVSLFSRLFGSYAGYPKYMEKWESFV